MGENLAADGGSGLDIRPLATPALPEKPASVKKSGQTENSQSARSKAAPPSERGDASGRSRTPRAKPLDDESAASASESAASASDTGEKPSSKPASAKSKAESKPAAAEDEASSQDGSRKPAVVPKSLLRTSMALSFSTLVHLILVIALGMWFLPAIIKDQAGDLEAFVETTPEELLNQVLETKVDPSKTLSLTSAAPAGGAAGAGGGGMAGLSQPTFDRSVAESGEIAAMSVGSLSDFSTPGNHFSMDLPEGALGEPQAVVDSYSEAMDRITQELLQMLAKGKVLVIWCFDESESMKDDQKEIRDRIERVYEELGLAESAQGDALWSAVASYGEGFHLHTRKPTANLDEIRSAIGEVPIDHTGKEMMCSAVGQSIKTFHKFATSGHRQMALILVTDESGDEQDNFQNLEAALKEARDTRCKIFSLGREAVFGYPYVHMHWVDPATKIDFWLRIDRGPETPFPEQLQIDGFTRRWDAHPSGFGPYEQVRLAQQTGGVFFMLPSPEVNLVARDDRKYELEAMRPYLPTLTERMAYAKERDKSEFRRMLWEVIVTLNPYNKESEKYCTVQATHFPINRDEFAKAAIMNQQKAIGLLRYFTDCEKRLDKIRPLRAKEQSPRWRANYDLMDAQILAYKVRIQEYGVYLGEFMKQPKLIKNPLGPTKKTTHWDINTRKETLTGDKTKDDIARATVLLQQIVKEHAGTPWAARAQWELNRGFGVDLHEAFYDPRRGSIKPPNL
ncbi:MAG TPA: vWA domain-containing protein [Pirellulales bacterium]|nr:vWA domain-containing protein [Pirellulales bacterium]